MVFSSFVVSSRLDLKLPEASCQWPFLSFVGLTRQSWTLGKNAVNACLKAKSNKQTGGGGRL